MPISIEQLDSSAKEENITLILGKNILLRVRKGGQANAIFVIDF